MAGPLAGGGTGAVVAGGRAATTAASAVPRPSSGAAVTAAATSPVDAIRFRRVRTWRRPGVPGSEVAVVIGVTFHSRPERAGCGQPNIFTCARKQVTAARNTDCVVRRRSGKRDLLHRDDDGWDEITAIEIADITCLFDFPPAKSLHRALLACACIISVRRVSTTRSAGTLRELIQWRVLSGASPQYRNVGAHSLPAQVVPPDMAETSPR